MTSEYESAVEIRDALSGVTDALLSIAEALKPHAKGEGGLIPDLVALAETGGAIEERNRIIAIIRENAPSKGVADGLERAILTIATQPAETVNERLLAVCKALAEDDDIAQGYGGLCAHLNKLRVRARAAIAARKVQPLTPVNAAPELEAVSDKLSDVWLHLDAYARGETFTPEMAKHILRHQGCPGWKADAEKAGAPS